jgi:parvulin-like peptidyl-prolyl isomerase
VLARLHSGDDSAARGGDMGYLHRGMLPETVQEVVDRLALSEVSEPISLLEGIALVRLDDRKLAQVRDFASVRERTLQLWRRDEGDRAWQALIARLRSATPIEVVDASRYPQLSADLTATPAALAR